MQGAILKYIWMVKWSNNAPSQSITLTAHLMSLEEVRGFKNDMNFLQTLEVFFLEEEERKIYKQGENEWGYPAYENQYNEEITLILG